MTQQAELLQKVETLPPKYFGEVIDFAGYLQQKARQENDRDDVYAGIPSKLDDDLLQSQLDVLEKADW